MPTSTLQCSYTLLSSQPVGSFTPCVLPVVRERGLEPLSWTVHRRSQILPRVFSWPVRLPLGHPPAWTPVVTALNPHGPTGALPCGSGRARTGNLRRSTVELQTRCAPEIKYELRCLFQFAIEVTAALRTWRSWNRQPAGDQGDGAIVSALATELQDPRAPAGFEPATSHLEGEELPIYAPGWMPVPTEGPG